MASTQSDSTIPVIPLEDSSTECAKELVDAARQWGFLYISAGSDIPQSKIDRMFELVRSISDIAHYRIWLSTSVNLDTMISWIFLYILCLFLIKNIILYP